MDGCGRIRYRGENLDDWTFYRMNIEVDECGQSKKPRHVGVSKVPDNKGGLGMMSP
jgi:hypothetical protein